MKEQARILGIDDSKFEFSDSHTDVIGVVMRADGYLEGVMKDTVEVDGTDANSVITQMVLRSRYRKQLRLIITDGIALGGFNIIDLEKLHHDTGIPVAAVTRNKPDFEEIMNALQKHFKDWEQRFETVCNGELFKIPTEHSPIWVKGFGMSKKELKAAIQMSTIRGALPEPIRIAHIIATALVDGESKGRA